MVAVLEHRALPREHDRLARTERVEAEHERGGGIELGRELPQRGGEALHARLLTAGKHDDQVEAVERRRARELERRRDAARVVARAGHGRTASHVELERERERQHGACGLEAERRCDERHGDRRRERIDAATAQVPPRARLRHARAPYPPGPRGVVMGNGDQRAVGKAACREPRDHVRPLAARQQPPQRPDTARGVELPRGQCSQRHRGAERRAGEARCKRPGGEERVVVRVGRRAAVGLHLDLGPRLAQPLGEPGRAGALARSGRVARHRRERLDVRADPLDPHSSGWISATARSAERTAPSM
jgi:hypothetical protein